MEALHSQLDVFICRVPVFGILPQNCYEFEGGREIPYSCAVAQTQLLLSHPHLLNTAGENSYLMTYHKRGAEKRLRQHVLNISSKIVMIKMLQQVQWMLM
jgi:hypothetical protein